MTKEKQPEEPPSKLKWWHVAGVVVLILGLWITCYFVVKDMEKPGVFGDMFGSINALFSGLALAGIVLTLYLQREEIKLQRHDLRIQWEELTATREQIERSAEAQEKSEKALSKQAESMRISSELTALNTLLNYYIQQREYTGNHPAHGFSQKIADCRVEIEKILKKISD